MLGSSLQLVTDHLNAAIARRFQTPSGQKHVILSPLFNLGQGLAPAVENVLVLIPVNIQQESFTASDVPTRPGKFAKMNPPLSLQLHFVLGVYYSAENIQEGLNVLTVAMQVLEGKQVWNTQNTPGLPSEILKITTELCSLTFEQVNHLWGSLGGKQMPNAVYKMRVLLTDEQSVIAEIPTIERLDVEKS